MREKNASQNLEMRGWLKVINETVVDILQYVIE
jgi:hypothetical protein